MLHVYNTILQKSMECMLLKDESLNEKYLKQSLSTISAISTKTNKFFLQFLLHFWHPPCYTKLKNDDKSWTRKEAHNFDQDKRETSIIVNHML